VTQAIRASDPGDPDQPERPPAMIVTVVAVVYDLAEIPVPGIKIRQFVVEYPCGCWIVTAATPTGHHIPAPPSGDFGRPLAEVANMYHIRPKAQEHLCQSQ
jgi:hypothetical protein